MQFKKYNFITAIKDITPLSLWGSLALLLLGLLITVLITLNTKADIDSSAKQEFDFTSSQITQKIEERLNARAQILYSGAALFAVKGDITRQEWQTFTHQLPINSQLPGIQGFGFSVLIPAVQLPKHIQQIRSEGFPDYKVWPEGERNIYTSIIYLEPFSGRNLRAFGYDMFSEPVRRTAMERARDGNNAALSGKVVLVQETEQDIQAGTLLFVPVYQNGKPIETIAQRRAALIGWVYNPYRMNDLMSGILGDWGSQTGQMIRLEIFDGNQINPAGLLYNSLPTSAGLPAEPVSTKIIPIDFAGQRWSLRFSQTDTLASTLDYSKMWVVFLNGVLLNLMIFGLLLSWLTMRANAQKMAVDMTAKLRTSETKFRAIINSADDIVFTLDTEQRYNGIFGNWPKKMQRTQQDFLGRTSLEIMGEQAGRVHAEANQRALAGEITGYEWVQKEAAQTRYFQTIVSPLRNDDGQITGVLGVGRDITEFKLVDVLQSLNNSLQQADFEREAILKNLTTYQVELKAQNEALTQTQRQLISLQDRYFNLYDLAPAGYCTLSTEGLVLEANLTAAGQLGTTRKAILNKPLSNFIFKEHQDIYYFHRKTLIETGLKQICEIQLEKKGGELFWAQVESSIIQSEKGTHEYRVLISDISERKRVELALAQTATRLSLAVRAGGVGTWELDIINNRLAWDDQMYRLYGINPQNFSGAYDAWLKGVHPQDRERGDNEIQAAQRGEKDFDTEFRVVWPDGSIHEIHALALVRRDISGKPFSLIGTNWDVTDQKLMMKRLQTTVTEKDALLREVHHRVKNNLAAIIGLIGLQESSLIDPGVKIAFNELGSRVSAMALVHELLYSSETLTSIDLQSYLERLTSQLSHLYQSSANIQINIAAYGVIVDLDTAIPCGLIVTEQITNSFKYAFPDGQPRPGQQVCKITVSASQNGSAYTLTISDNGVGLPAGFDWKKSPTLGMSLIRMLGEHQLGATIQLESSAGACIELKFDEKLRS